MQSTRSTGTSGRARELGHHPRAAGLPPAQVVERLLLPQHRALRTKLAAISRLTAGAPRAQGSRPLGRVHLAVVLEEVATMLSTTWAARSASCSRA